jgi:hypothetical protein
MKKCVPTEKRTYQDENFIFAEDTRPTSDCEKEVYTKYKIPECDI